jgi:hypothetical protein
MPMGPGKYDEDCTMVRERNHAEGVLIIVFGGSKGTGFSWQLSGALTLLTPQILRDVAKMIEDSGGSA